MIGATTTSAGCISIELEVPIDAPCEVVWKAIFEDTQMWWLEDFCATGPGAKVNFDPTPGGSGMVELTADGGGLLWFNVQMHLPEQFKIYLVGHIAPEWGGPTTSNLKLALEPTDSGCVLQVTDARHGHIDESQTQSYSDGWTQLFTNGLKKFVESR